MINLEASMRKTTRLLFGLKIRLLRLIYPRVLRSIRKLDDVKQLECFWKLFKINYLENLKLTYPGNKILALDKDIVGMISLLMAINKSLKGEESIVMLYRESSTQHVAVRDFLTDSSGSYVNVHQAFSLLHDEVGQFIKFQKETNLSEGAHRYNARLITQLNKQLIDVLQSFVSLLLTSPLKG